MDDNIKQVFTNNLIYQMKKNKVNQQDIANYLKVAKSTVSSWCNAQKIPRMDKIELLANYFGVLKSDLLENKLDKQEEDDEFNRLYSQLTPENKELVKAMMKGLTSKK